MILDFLSVIDNMIWSPLLIVLLATGFYFTYKLGFVQFTMIKEAMKVMFQSEGGDTGVKPFQAFVIGLASRIGAGNITGVATAILVGGAGSIFWMWAVALIVASSSFIENTLAQIYKEKEAEKGFVGGPSYYMKKALNMPRLGLVFALVLIGCYGIAFISLQSNTISSITVSTFPNVNPVIISLVVGVVLVILIGSILLGGSKRIANFSTILVPFMSIGYLLMAIIVFIVNIETVPTVISLIFSEAFTLQSITGATLGGIIITGARRGMFSNEAGMGSAPNAAATATTSHPVKQGLIQMIGVFIDTLIICTATGIIILTSLSASQFITFSNEAINNPSFNAVTVTQVSLVQSLGTWSGYVLAIFIFFFALTSIIGNYYYSESSFEYITKKKVYLKAFRIFVLFVVFWGAVAKTDVLWSLADIFMGVMAAINIFAITLLSKFVYRTIEDYKKQKRENKNPIFKESNIKGLEGTIWTEENAKNFTE